MVALRQPSVLPPKPPLFKTSTQRWAMLEPVTTHEELSRFDFPVLLLTGDRSSNSLQGSIRAGRDDGLRHGIDFFGNAGPVFLALGWRHVASNEAV